MMPFPVSKLQQESCQHSDCRCQLTGTELLHNYIGGSLCEMLPYCYGLPIAIASLVVSLNTADVPGNSDRYKHSVL